MSSDAGLIDQRVRFLITQHGRLLESVMGRPLDEMRAHSAAFVALCVQLELGVPVHDAIRSLTDGGNDLGVDAVVIKDLSEDKILVTLFQGKYHRTFDERNAFPQGGVEKAVQAVRLILGDEGPKLSVNIRLRQYIAKIHKAYCAGKVIHVRVLLCSNGTSWDSDPSSLAQQVIDFARLGANTNFEHLGPRKLVAKMISPKPIHDTLQLVGFMHIQEFHHRRKLRGSVRMSELVRLLAAHEEEIFHLNIRRFLGAASPVNASILRTLKNAEERKLFDFYNNGIDIVCDSFSHNHLQLENHTIKLRSMQIINGLQTCRLIHHAMIDRKLWEPGGPGDEPIDVRVMQASAEFETELVKKIAETHNHQTVVELRELHSNDDLQRKLEADIQLLGYVYRRHSSHLVVDHVDISMEIAARAVLAVWRGVPQRAKRLVANSFDAAYETIFTEELNGAQVVLAVLLLRFAEQQEPLEHEATEAGQLRASYLAMLMGDRVLELMGIELARLHHLNFGSAKALLVEQGERLYQGALSTLTSALQATQVALHLSSEISLLEEGSAMEHLPTKPWRQRGLVGVVTDATTRRLDTE